jgi:pimeloyl-ACP methyl ester carboxylesterase
LVTARPSTSRLQNRLKMTAKDGYDVVEWLAKQPYCNGKIAMLGGSYAGYDQCATAQEFPSHLATIVPVSSVGPGVDFLVTHGWPGSVVEQLKIIDPLTNPTAHGASAADAFDLVIPSMPGYGFSGKPTSTGWGPERIAQAWAVLMERLGYTRYVAQGGDWGAIITDLMGAQAPSGLIGIHTNMAGCVPPEIDKAAFSGTPAPPDLSADERRAYDRLVFFYSKGLGYALEMGNRPQTLYGIADSPVGLAAWILDHDPWSLEMMVRVFDGQPEGLTPDDVLDNITLYWLTKTAVSSARLYGENKLAFFAPKGVAIPVAVSAFPEEICPAPKRWAERAYPKLIHYNKVDKGTHFAAWEQPELFVGEVRAGFRSLRQ